VTVRTLRQLEEDIAIVADLIPSTEADLAALQRPFISWWLRVQAALGLPGPPWRHVPLYNRVARGRRRPIGAFNAADSAARRSRH
jgi:hypothetical protein